MNLKEVHIPETYEEILNEAEIIGIIIGDGHINLKGGYIRLRVGELDFCENFSKLIRTTYKVNAPINNKYYYNCFVFSTLLTKRIAELTKNNKEISEFILQGDKNIKARFIRGFVDAEGNVDVIYNRRQIVITQLDVETLKISQKFLLDVGIQSTLIIKKVGCPQLIISLLENLQKYRDLIGFSIGYKQKKLEEAIDYLKKDKAHDKEKYWQVLRHWKLNDKSIRGSAKEFNMNWETYRSWIYGRKMPCQIKKDIEVGWVPDDYEKLRQNYNFLPKTTLTTNY